MANTNFADRLLVAIEEKENSSCVGLDTNLKFIPQYITKKYNNDLWQDDMPFHGESRSIIKFNQMIIDATKDIVPAYKLQIAFYEKYLDLGYSALRETCEYIKDETDCLCIVDAKRNDIGNTAEQYAQEFLGKVGTISDTDGTGEMQTEALNVDALTVNPYLGADGITPFTKLCKERGKGIFVLVKTSNKSSGDFQDIELNPDNQSAMIERNNPLFSIVGRKVAEWGEELVGERGYSSVGAVVGATYPHQAESLRKMMPKTIFLVPGYGAQGGGASEVMPSFDENGLGAIVNNSRGIIAAHQKQFKDKYPAPEFYKAAREAAQIMKDDINSALKKAGKLR